MDKYTYSKRPVTIRRSFQNLRKIHQPSKSVKLDTVAVVGLGYVGLPLALLADKKGHRVIGLDTNESLLKDLQTHTAPAFIEGEDEVQYALHEIEARTDSQIVSEAQVVIVCVPTPVFEDHTPDLEPLIAATKAIAPSIQAGTLVIIESTVSPGVCEDILLPMLEKANGLVREKTLLFAHCPERINPGDPKWNLSNIPRVVGAVGLRSLKKATNFYSELLDAPIRPMRTIREAEAVKMVENSFRDINIAFVNELAMSFQTLGIDIVGVIKGASTKPFGFMPHYPGIGVGGHCIPVDPYYLIAEAKKNGFNHKFLKVARRVNNGMPKFAVTLLKNALHKKGIEMKNARVAVLGLAYKKNISDTRESPSLKTIQELQREGAEVSTFDPFTPHLSTATSVEDALTGAQAVIVATDHDQFKTLSAKMLKDKDVKIILDGKNFLEKELFTSKGITHIGIGR